MTSNSWKQLTRLLGYLKEWKWQFTGAVIFIILMSYSNSIIPVLIRDAIDKGVTARNVDAAIKYGLLILLAGVLNGLFSFTARMLQVKAAQGAVYRLRLDAFSSIQRHSMEFFNKTLVGQLISRVTNDAERITGFLAFRLRMLVYSSFLIAISLYYMIEMNHLLTLVALVTILLVMLVNIVYARKVRPVYDKIRHQTGVLAGASTSIIAGIKTVKALAAERFLFNTFESENRKLYDLNVVATKISSIYGNAPFLVLGASMSAMLFLGGRLIIGGVLSVGELAAFLMYMLTLMWPLRALGFTIGDVQRTLAAASRLFEIIDSAPETLDQPDAIEISEAKGEIEFRDVWFQYASGKTVLKGVSFKIRPGEKVLITGPPGSGKSTILKLILRLYEPQKGQILIDGVDIRKIKLESLRRIVSYVPQEPFLFNRSIKENIAIGKPDATIEEIKYAARVAKIHDFIESLPNKYDTIVGEKGITLSGGQRQRIAIARAILANPKILLLDDPVSNLDAETEKALVRDLKEILKDKTAVIVSQRLSLAGVVDRVIVMEDGRIIEDGPPQELLKKRGRFYEMYLTMGADHGRK